MYIRNKLGPKPSEWVQTHPKGSIIGYSSLRSTLQVFRLLGFFRIFLYNAKPSFEIAKWMAKHMLWQNMKINKIIQQKLKSPKPTSLEDLHQKGTAAKRPPPFWSNDLPDVGF